MNNFISEDLLLNIEEGRPFLFLGTRNCDIVSNQFYVFTKLKIFF